jgi:hypothetical protein
MTLVTPTVTPTATRTGVNAAGVTTCSTGEKGNARLQCPELLTGEHGFGCILSVGRRSCAPMS